MDEKKLIENIKYLVNKYLINRNDLIEMILSDIDSVKYVMAEINKGRDREYERNDLVIIKEISYYYL